MDYVIWDFRGQSNGRPTRCSQRESCLVKVFRFQRKTLLFLLGFFFLIKVFRFQRKTLLFLLGFFFLIIKVFRFQRKTLLFLLGFFFPIIIIFFFLPFLCHGFLENASIDFYEIFTHDTLW